MPAAIRVLLADDHHLVRAGLRVLVAGFDGVQVVGEAGDGYQTLRQVEALRPDVVLMDIAMPQLNGLEAAARVAREYRSARVIVLSMHSSEEYVHRALRAGAAGYVLKGAAPAELEVAIRAVARGDTYLSPPISKQVVASYMRRMGGESALEERLTPRQREVLQLIAEGRSTKEIARTLGISVKTVETHRTQLMDELDIHEVAGLVRYAIRMGLVSSER